ncbi:MFS transporter, partial [Aeromonas hydrophila]|uniref:MFS transporter n=2 Tax=Aeromonas TaxID=642 RepID=UPI0020B3CA14
MPDSTHMVTPAQRKWLPPLTAVGFFMQTLDGTILNTALPSMAETLGESPLQMQSVIIAYMLTVALLIPASGWLADRFGTRRIYLAAILLFTLGSLACAAANSLPMLVAARVLQGIGGALLMPVGRLAVLRVYSKHELLRVMSFVTIPGLVGPLIGPALGGWLVEVASWHWVFLINLPVGLLGFIASWYFMPDLRQSTAKFDWQGFVMFSAGMVLVSVGLQGLGEHSISTGWALFALLFGLAAMASYWLYAANAEEPLFGLGLFKTSTFAIGIWGNLFARLGSGAMPFLTPLFLQLGLGFSPSKAGMTMIPTVL